MAELSVYEAQLKKKRKTGIPRLMEIAGTKVVYLVFAGLLGVIAVVAQITPFYTIYLFVQELVNNIGNIREINVVYVRQLCWITLAGLGVFGVLTYFSLLFSHVAAFNILYEIRIALAAKLARIPMGYFTGNARGKIKKVLHEDVERIELFVAHHLTDFIQAVTLPVIALIFLFIMDWRLALGVLIPLPIAFIAQASMLNKKGLRLYETWQSKMANMNATIVEFIRGMPVVKVFNQTVAAFKRFSKDVYDYRDLTIHWTKLSTVAYSGFMTFLSSSALFILPIALLIISSLPAAGYSTMVSTIFLFLYISMGIAIPLNKIMRLSTSLIQINTGLACIDDVLEEEEIVDSAVSNEAEEGTVEFRNVSFSYDQEKVVDNISFHVPKGSVTALVGPSGGGKSTIASLIGRFWDVDEGEVCIGGVNIKDIPVEALNNTVSTVFQDVFLFFDTIEENIRMGNDSASFEEVVAAAKAAQIHDFIETLPDGYKTLIGEGGTYLSGGEQQRISIARAILKDAPIVVLDEATAYADPENEARIQVALSEVLRDKTVIIIAHRLYTITDADQILVIHEGKVDESGKHSSLLERDGLYKKLWDIHAKARDWNINQGVTQ